MRRIQLPAWMTILVLSLSGMAGSLQFTLPIPLLPSMPGVLGITPNDASWIITATLLTSTIATPIISRMADMYGKRRMLVLSLAMMAAGSAIVALSSTFAWVLVGRGVQGIASAVVPIGISLLKDKLPKERSNSAVALMSATLGIGSAMGMPLSGVISESLGWRAVFWTTAIIGVVLVALMYAIVRESPLRTGGRFDISGDVLLATLLTATLLLVSKFAQWPTVVLIALAVVAAVGLAGWIPLQLRHKQPMVVLAPVSGWLLDRFGGRPVLIAGNLVLALGFVLRVIFDSTIPGIIVGSTIIGIGTSFAFSAMPTLIMASVPNTATSAANGVNSLVRSLGTAFCSALVGFLVGVMAAPNSGGEFISIDGLHLCFALAASSAAIAAVIAMFVPRGIHAQTSAPGADGTEKVVVRGQVTTGGEGRIATASIVTFMHMDGTPVDWSRVDGQGQYLAVLPGPGKYVAVATAVGWAPRSGVLEATGEQVQWDVRLRRQFTVSGSVSCAAGPAAHALVAFYLSGNDFVGSVRCDEDGEFELPLPQAGRYIVTAIGADGDWTHSTKTSVGLESVRLAIRAGLVTEHEVPDELASVALSPEPEPAPLR